MDQAKMEEFLCTLPLAQYAWIDPQELVFTERVRKICEMECPMYAKTWACPPAVGSVEECKARCLSYPHALMFTTLTEVSDIADLQETLETRAPHEEITRAVVSMMQTMSEDVMALSTEACAICETCAYPNGPCRHRDRMFPCVESHGILATDIAEKHGIDFYDGNIVTWFSIIFYR